MREKKCCCSVVRKKARTARCSLWSYLDMVRSSNCVSDRGDPREKKNYTHCIFSQRQTPSIVAAATSAHSAADAQLQSSVAFLLQKA